METELDGCRALVGAVERELDGQPLLVEGKRREPVELIEERALDLLVELQVRPGRDHRRHARLQRLDGGGEVGLVQKPLRRRAEGGPADDCTMADANRRQSAAASGAACQVKEG